MNTINSVISVIWLCTPPLLMIVISNRWIAFASAVAVCWFSTIVGTECELAFTPDYDSIAPGLAIFVGWIPAVFYSLFWLVLIVALRRVSLALKPSQRLSESDENGEC